MSADRMRIITHDNTEGRSSLFKVALIYVVFVIIGFIYVSRFTIPVHIRTDEELYLSMARSFHAGQGFVQYGQSLNYSSVLYSVIISAAYYFYSPEHILLIIRCINVLIMLSAVFPTYMLCKAVTGDDNMSVLTAIVCSLMPELAMSGYIMQETLYYPMLLWAFYFMYLDMAQSRVSYRTVLTSALYILAFWTKTVGFIFPLIYAGWTLIMTVKRKAPKPLLKAAVISVTCLIMLALGRLFVYAVNMGGGTNHYSSQAANLFPITIITARCLIAGILVYLACTLISMGVFPVAVPIKLRRYMDEHDRDYMYIMLLFLIATIAEIILLVVYTENRDFIVPKKFLYRYMFPMFVPFMILMIKALKLSGEELQSVKIRKDIIAFTARTLIISALVMLIYYCIIGSNGMSGLVDGMLFTVITNVNNHVWQYSGAIFALILLIGAIIIQAGKGSLSGKLCSAKRIIQLYIVVFVIIDIVSFVWFPYYNNVYCNGRTIEPQMIQIAGEINKGTHDKLIHVCRASYLQDSIWGYINEDYMICQLHEYDTMMQEYIQDSQDETWYMVIDKDIMSEMQEYDLDTIVETDDYILVSTGGVND